MNGWMNGWMDGVAGVVQDDLMLHSFGPKLTIIFFFVHY